jgi:CPA2 family monovalent cation:H+ antiporter-2
VLFLATAGVIVPLFKRLKISPILGFLGAGVILGPYGLGAAAKSAPLLALLTITNQQDIGEIAEFGVVFLLFMIGLELSFERLRLLRRLVFGLGGAQTVLSAAGLALVAAAFGQPPAAAAVIGMALALSSTAIIVPSLVERRRLHSDVGRPRPFRCCCSRTWPWRRSWWRFRCCAAMRGRSAWTCSWPWSRPSPRRSV